MRKVVVNSSPLITLNFTKAVKFDIIRVGKFTADRYAVYKWSGCKFTADRYAVYKWSGCK